MATQYQTTQPHQGPSTTQTMNDNQQQSATAAARPGEAQQDKQFFATISQFKSQDFSESTNPEMLYIRSLIEEFDANEMQRASSLNSQGHQSFHQAIGYAPFGDQFAMASSPIFTYPNVAQYPVQASLANRDKNTQVQTDGWFDGSQRLRIPQRGFPTPTLPPFKYDDPHHNNNHIFSDPERTQGSKYSIPSCSPQSLNKRMKVGGGVEMIDDPRLMPPPTVLAPPPRETSSRPVRKASLKKPESDGDSAGTLGDSDNENNALPQFPASIHGETRLNINFINRGTVGAVPQRFGKNNCIIPDSLSGTHQMYEQKWKFEIKHELQNGMVLIRWTIHNLTSDRITSVMETVQDALNRESCGRTICNNVLKKALETRAQEIEQSLSTMQETNLPRASNMRNLVKVLRPKRCTVGLLFFGLLHEQIQASMAKMLAERTAAANVATELVPKV